MLTFLTPDGWRVLSLPVLSPSGCFHFHSDLLCWGQELVNWNPQWSLQVFESMITLLTPDGLVLHLVLLLCFMTTFWHIAFPTIDCQPLLELLLFANFTADDFNTFI